ncbi:50S ribosomal protein L3 N(5)-glutamine methyltransferase [Legionella sp. CNM-4043-24]|uniref:50S ribosomal protein L3 N(5)-glutamine methyltransferase n=1 Tax=Legionella sp. CNM-4043-24 TaxID=3421646 RepID=UPI00403AF9E1
MTTNYEAACAPFETILDFLRYGISEASRHDLYYGHGTDNVLDDMTALVLGSLHLPYDSDYRLLSARLSAEEKVMLAQLLERRIHDRVPVPYLTGTALFCGLDFYVDERVLIPRSPVAELINQQFSPWIDPDRVERVLDLCTGSGCIAIACSYAFPDAQIDAVDLSPDALDVADINRARHGLDDDDIRLIESDCFDKVPDVRYQIIVSNPPYVGDEEMDSLPDEYRHEPDMALRTGHNGLAIVEKILAVAHNYLSDDGILVVEVGNSEEALVEAYPDLPFTWLDFEQGGHGVFLLTCAQLKAHAGQID